MELYRLLREDDSNVLEDNEYVTVSKREIDGGEEWVSCHIWRQVNGQTLQRPRRGPTGMKVVGFKLVPIGKTLNNFIREY